MTTGEPTWLPPVIAKLSKSILVLGLGIDQAALLKMLTYSPKMKHVWATLLRKRRSKDPATRGYFHPTLLDPNVCADHMRGKILRLQGLKSPTKLDRLNEKLFAADEREARKIARREGSRPPEYYQNQALEKLFRIAFEGACYVEPVFAKAIAADARRWAKLSRKLKTCADLVKSNKSLARDLLRLAKECDSRIREIRPPISASMPTADDPWIIVRNRGDARERSLIVDLNLAMRNLFAADLSSTVATIAAVVLEKEGGLGRDRVREVVKKRAPRAP